VANTKLDQLCINTIRCLSIDSVQKANAGHPGAPWVRRLWLTCCGTATCATIHQPQMDGPRPLYSLARTCLRAALQHAAPDRLRPAAGRVEELPPVRQQVSRHSEYAHTPGVETTTGPLGQGASNGVGMAMAQKYLASYFNRPATRSLTTVSSASFPTAT